MERHITCGLCPPDHPPLTAAPEQAWYVAVDHALDEHRAVFLADPDTAGDAFRFTRP